jgi:hypothetical protein
MKGLRELIKKVELVDEWYLIKWEVIAFVFMAVGMITVLLCR